MLAQTTTCDIKVDFAIISAVPEELDFINNTFPQQTCKIVKIGKFQFRIYAHKNKKSLVTYTGIGTTFAASVIAYIDYHFNPDYFFLSGTARAINSELKICDVVIAEKAFEAEMQAVFALVKGTPFESCLIHPLNNEHFPAIYPANVELLQIADTVDIPGIKIYRGTVVSSNAFPVPQELFGKIKTLNPYSIDMETSALYQ